VPALAPGGDGAVAAFARAAGAAPAVTGLGSAIGPASAGAVPTLTVADDVHADTLELASRSTTGFTPQGAPLARPFGDR
jgi:hypothetical protein